MERETQSTEKICQLKKNGPWPAHMNIVKILVALGIVGSGFHLWNQHQSNVALAAVLATADAYGFVDLPAAEGQSADTIYVVAAQNCPHEAAQRADRLARDLGDKGFPVVRTNAVNFSTRGIDADGAKRLNAIMNGPLPIIFVHHKAKSAASTEDVVAEFRQFEK